MGLRGGGGGENPGQKPTLLGPGCLLPLKEQKQIRGGQKTPPHLMPALLSPSAAPDAP